MRNQSDISSTLTKEQFDSLSSNLAEAMQVLFKSVATRILQERIQKIKDAKSIQNVKSYETARI